MGCADTPTRAVAALPADLPRFEAGPERRGVARSNIDIAEDFMDLMFQLEGGQTVPNLLKYEGPVRIALRTPGLETYRPEIDALIERIRREAGIDIALTSNVARADIHIQAVPRAVINQAFPGAACFIIPGIDSWKAYRRPFSSTNLSWSNQTALGTTAIFIPGDSSPQETRDCLHEEIAQALGPANDIYRLADTVFNDDNFHSVLTPFDLVILRTLYDPALSAGMSRRDVAARLPGILARTNPRGEGLPPRPRAPESPTWNKNIELALIGPSGPRRIKAARAAVSEAVAMSPPDHRYGFSAMTLGRVMIRRDPATAGAYLDRGYRQFVSLFGRDSIHTTNAALHRSLFALSIRNFAAASGIAQAHMKGAKEAQNAFVLAGLHAVAAEAEFNLGNLPAALYHNRQSLSWSRYAFGNDESEIDQAQAEIAGLKNTPNRTTNP